MQKLNSKAGAQERHHQQLLQESAEGSRAAFSQLYDLLYTPLVRFIYRYTPSEVLIEEILNDTMLVVWQKADSFRGDSRVLTWVLGIASRRALKAVHREHAWEGKNDRHPDIIAVSGDTGRLSTLQALDWALQQLNVEQRLAIELAYFHGMSCEEMAEVLQCPPNTAKTRLHYGRRKLLAAFANADPALEFNDLMDEASP